MHLTGKAILVTGSSQGIGLAVGRAMLRAGARVVFHSEKPLIDCPELADLPMEDAAYVRADLCADGEPERLMRAAWELFGPLDVLVNNAGTFREPAFASLTKEHFDATFRLNVWAGLACTMEFVRLNRESGRGGRILFSTSLNATRSEPGHTLYDASKGAVNALVRQLAVELAPDFTAAAIAPGLIETPLTDFGLRSDPAARQAIVGQIPLRRIGTVEDVAEWYVFLAGGGADYATGIVLTVDGGLDAQQMPSRPITRKERSEPGT